MILFSFRSIVIKNSSLNSNPKFNYECLNILFQCYFDKNENEKAKYYFNNIANHKPLTTVDYGNIASIEMALGNPSKAKTYLDSANMLCDTTNLQDLIAVKMSTKEFARKTGDFKTMVEQSEQLFTLQDNEIKRILKQSALGAQRDFYNKKSTEAIAKEARTRNYAIIGSIAAILIILVLMIFFRMKMLLKNKNLKLKIQEVALLSAKINTQGNEINKQNKQLRQGNHLRSTVERLIAERFNHINGFFDEYYENSDSIVGKTYIFNKVEYELKSLSSPQNLSEIENLINDALDNIIFRFRSEFPELSSTDITLFMLNIAGLSPRAIGLFLNIKLKTVYTRKARLRHKIENSSATDRDEFLRRLS